MVDLGIPFLGLLTDQVLHELLRIVCVPGCSRHADTTDIHMCPSSLLIGPEKPHFLCRCFLLRILAGQHGAYIVSVRYRDIALAGSCCLDLIAITTFWRTCKVGHQSPGPCLGLLFAVIRNHRGDKRLVVDVVRGTDTNTPFPFFTGQRLVSRELGRIDLVFHVEDRSSPL